jgi:Fic family protein
MRHRDVVLNERQKKVLDRLLEAGPHGFIGGLSTKKYMTSTGVSRATAFRELDAMMRAGLLVARGQAKSTRYYPAIDGWAPQRGD